MIVYIQTVEDVAFAAHEAELVNRYSRAEPHHHGIGLSKNAGCAAGQLGAYFYPQPFDAGKTSRGKAYERAWDDMHPVASIQAYVVNGKAVPIRVEGHAQLCRLLDDDGNIVHVTHADAEMYNLATREIEMWDIKNLGGTDDSNRKRTVAWALEQDDETPASPFTAMARKVERRATPTGKALLAIELGDDSTDKTLLFTYWEPVVAVNPGDWIRLTRAYITTDSYTGRKAILLSMGITGAKTKTGKPKKDVQGGVVQVVNDQLNPVYHGQVTLEAGIRHDELKLRYWPMCRLQISDPFDWNVVKFQSWRCDPAEYARLRKRVFQLDALKAKGKAWFDTLSIDDYRILCDGLDNWKTTSWSKVRAECEHCDYAPACAKRHGITKKALINGEEAKA
nr:hypothetical protein [Candidatus Sigynarchaeum springense]